MPSQDALYGVGPVMQGGSGAVAPGANAFYGFQQELMRRLAQEELDKANARQVEQDALNAEVRRAGIENTKANTQSMVDQRNQGIADKALASAVAPLRAGDDITAAQADMMKKNGGAGYVTEVPAMTGGVPSQFAAAPEGAAASEVPVTAGGFKFKGTPKEADDAEHKAMAQRILNGEFDTGDPQYDRYQKAQATNLLIGSKSSVPSAAVAEPKKATETLAEESIGMHKLEARMKTGYVPSAEEKASYDVWKSRNATDAEKDAAHDANAAAAAKVSDDRQAKTQLFQVKQAFRRELVDAEKNTDKDVERSDRALALLANPNFLTDAVAGPEFLQITAGGMGSGLRMTDAELRRVNDAQSKLDQLKGSLAKWGILDIGQRRTIQDEMRGQMQSALEAVHAARTRKAKLAAETLAGLDTAADAQALDTLHSKYWNDRTEAGSMRPEAAPAGAAPAAGGHVLTYDPKTGTVH